MMLNTSEHMQMAEISDESFDIKCTLFHATIIMIFFPPNQIKKCGDSVETNID